MNALTGKIFTGQRYIEDGIARHSPRESVACAKCQKPIGLRTVLPEDTGIAWFDPYRGKGKYVCYGCLSEKRQAEIVEERKSTRRP